MNPPGNQSSPDTGDPRTRPVSQGGGAGGVEGERVVHPREPGAEVIPSGNYPQRAAATPPQAQAQSPGPARASAGDGGTEIISLLPDSKAPRRRLHRNRKASSPLKWLGMFAAIQLVLGLLFFALFGGVIRGWLQETAVAPDGVSATEAADLRKQVHEAEAEFAELSADLKLVKKQIAVSPGDAWAELGLLSARNQLTMLADDAITNGSRSAYDQLVETSEEPGGDQRLKDGAVAEILRVKSFYASGTRLGSYTLPVATLYPSQKTAAEEALSSTQLIALLGDQEKHWRVRTRAAYLLGSRRDLEVAAALVRAVKTDPNLDVVKECVYTFEENTGYRSKGLFEIESLVNWWTVYEARVGGVTAEVETPDPS